MSVQIAITGVRELDNVLKMLPKSMDHQTWSKINYDRSKVVEQAMKANAPIGPTHNLVNSIGRAKMSKNYSELGAVRTGPRQRGKHKGFHANFIEKGFKTRLKPGNPGKARVEANPFLERSWNQTKGTLKTNVADSAAKVLVRTMRRYLK